MGDVTQVIINVEGGAEHVRRHLSDLGWEYLYSPWGSDDTKCSLDEWLEGSVGAGDELHAKIASYIRNVPGPNRPQSIAIVEDGKYEWNGTIYRWLPVLGWHKADINTDGSVSVDAKTLLTVVAKSPNIDVARKRIDRLVGTAWDGAGQTSTTQSA